MPSYFVRNAEIGPDHRSGTFAAKDDYAACKRVATEMVPHWPHGPAELDRFDDGNVIRVADIPKTFYGDHMDAARVVEVCKACASMIENRRRLHYTRCEPRKCECCGETTNFVMRLEEIRYDV